MSILSENIKALRKKNRFTQQALADQIGVKRSLIGAYEESRADVRPDVLESIAKLFGISALELRSKDLTAFSSPVQTELLGLATLSKETDTPKPEAVQPEISLPTATSPQILTPRSELPSVQPIQEPTSNTESSSAKTFNKQPEIVTPEPPKNHIREHVEAKVLRTISIIQDSVGNSLVSLVPEDKIAKYPVLANNTEWLAGLETISLPNSKINQLSILRGFELKNANGSKAIFIGSYLRNWLNIELSIGNYLLITNQGQTHLGAIELNKDSLSVVKVYTAKGVVEVKSEEIFEIWKQESEIVFGSFSSGQTEVDQRKQMLLERFNREMELLKQIN